jgi:small GTP-binding protein
MIKKKVCMIGAYAVGKTSLVQRYVKSIFSDKYHTTIGVKIDQKNVKHNDKDITLILWDIHGEDEFQKVKSSYLIGAAGYFIVIDGTRQATVDVGVRLHEMALNKIGKMPFLVLVNKNDLQEEWEITDEHLKLFEEKNMKVIYTSAKSGEGVEEAFGELTKMMMD